MSDDGDATGRPAPEPRRRLTVSGGASTPLGRVVLAGHVADEEPMLSRATRMMDDLIVSVVLDGGGHFRSAAGVVSPIEPPCLTVVLPGEPHWYGTEPGEAWTEWFAVVSGPLFDTVRQASGPLRSGPRPLPLPARPEELARILRARRTPMDAEEQVWALAHWLSLALQPPPGADVDRMEAARARLVEDPGEPVELAAIARSLGLTYDQFRRGFHRHFGEAPLAYRNGYRLDVAASLLRLTSLTCREIAGELGFSDEFHLSRRFKARFGVSPTAYRDGASRRRRR